jgi:hypothetical protein
MPAEAPLIAEAPPAAPVAAPVSAPASSSPSTAIAPNRAGAMQTSLDALRQLDPSTKKPDAPKAPPDPKKGVAPKQPELPKAKETEPVAKETAPETDEPATAKVELDKSTGPKDWKLLNSIKTENARLKKQLEQFAASDTEKKTLAEQLETHRKDLDTTRQEKKRIEDLLRFRDYQNTEEFQQNYVAPWENAWNEAAANLKGIKITDDSGNEREISKNDIQSISEMDIAAARDAIRKIVPDVQDASDVRRYTDNIRTLTAKHKTALEKAWTESEKWQKDQHTKQQQAVEDRNRLFQTVHEENSTLFKQFDEEAKTKQEYLKPIEGDEEWNQKIEQAEKFVNESLVSNPNDPKLNKEQRAEMIRRNTAVIHRAKMFGPLKLENKRLKSQNAELQKKIAAYGESEPKAGNGQDKRSTAPAVSANPMEAAKQRFRQYVT